MKTGKTMKKKNKEEYFIIINGNKMVIKKLKMENVAKMVVVSIDSIFCFLSAPSVSHFFASNFDKEIRAVQKNLLLLQKSSIRTKLMNH